jgi:predicted flap endonuclease-1-like 5' DNA nuclease
MQSGGSCNPAGRKELAETTGLDASLILTWVNMADLFRIKGIGGEYAELLKKSGVDTVKELRNRNPENLLAKMTEVNTTGRQLVRALPSLSMVQSWVTLAKELDPMVTH